MGEDLTQQFIKTIEFYGSQNFNSFCEKNQIKLQHEILEVLEKNKAIEPIWEKFLNSTNLKLFDRNAVDLMNRMLRLNPVSLKE